MIENLYSNSSPYLIRPMRFKLIIGRVNTRRNSVKLHKVFYSDELQELIDIAFRYKNAQYNHYYFTCYDSDGNVLFFDLDMEQKLIK